MKLIISALAIALVSTAAFAGKSDRYHDIRLDTSKQSTTPMQVKTAAEAPKKATISSRSNPAPSYAYSNPYGVGPNNDSR